MLIEHQRSRLAARMKICTTRLRLTRADLLDSFDSKTRTLPLSSLINVPHATSSTRPSFLAGTASQRQTKDARMSTLRTKSNVPTSSALMDGFGSLGDIGCVSRIRMPVAKSRIRKRGSFPFCLASGVLYTICSLISSIHFKSILYLLYNDYDGSGDMFRRRCCDRPVQQRHCWTAPNPAREARTRAGPCGAALPLGSAATWPWRHRASQGPAALLAGERRREAPGLGDGQHQAIGIGLAAAGAVVGDAVID